ncbi:hypothetical protein HII31_12886 [Pseudocercospora fuligena]|uniref:Uncharacterized protein n=1 Tax=Pseudocercospora fuligena TaxID=685502 RepID=A0A8H6R619_9PEZI|nr:hypothetical protein HII31_12886 [Pseudocercospora fuligena]
MKKRWLEPHLFLLPCKQFPARSNSHDPHNNLNSQATSLHAATMGNGAKAQQKRERAGGKNEKKGPTSQLKSNSAAQTIKCKTCFTSFQSTTQRKALDEHAANKHSKTYDDCFA